MQSLLQRTEGNPFFLEESVQTLVETHVLVGDAGRLPSGQTPAERPGASDGPGGPGRADGSAAATGETPAADRRGHRHGGALCPRAGRGRVTRGRAPPVASPTCGPQSSCTRPPLPRSRLHLQARPHPRGGLRQSPSGAATGPPRPHRRGPRGARCDRWPNRSNAWPTMPCGARCGKGRGLLPAGRRQGWTARRSARRWRTTNRPWSASGTCPRPRHQAAGHRTPPRAWKVRCTRWESMGGVSPCWARPRPGPGRSAIGPGWDGCWPGGECVQIDGGPSRAPSRQASRPSTLAARLGDPRPASASLLSPGANL